MIYAGSGMLRGGGLVWLVPVFVQRHEHLGSPSLIPVRSNSRQMNSGQGEHQLSLEQVLRVLRRRWLLIALCALLAAGSAFAYSASQTKEYTATAALVFNNTQLSEQIAGLQTANGGDPQAQRGTNVQLVMLGTAADTTARALDHGLTAAAVRDSLTVSSDANSNIVRVAATSTSPELSAQIANTYAKAFVDEQRQSSGEYFRAALGLVEKQLSTLTPEQRNTSAGLALQDRAQSLKILTQIGAGDVRIAQGAAVPKSPSAPKVLRITVLTGILGLLAGVAAAFLLERLDRRIKDPEELAQTFDVPLLAAVPESAAYPRQSRDSSDGNGLPVRESEVFRMLRAHLRYFNVNRELRVVLVTSAAPGDGKTTVVQNLAEAAAGAGSRVLIIEADLRRPTLAARQQLRRTPGLAEVLILATAAEDAIQSAQTPTQPSLSSNARGSVNYLVAGSLPPNPAELIESQSMRGLVDWAADHYDLVLIDSGPLTVVPDAIPLLSYVNGVVIVGRIGKNTRDEALRLHEQLTSLDAPVLGVVANGLKQRGASYGYTSYDSYAPNAPASDPKEASVF